ncbi:MAG: PAS domain S-box protein [Anaerolineales bacterium]|nr:PAS domain S-box protein [Anaerolineales bacterium]
MRTIHGVPADLPLTIASWVRLIHPDDQAATFIAVTNAMETGGQVSVEYRVVHPDGATHYVLCTGGVTGGVHDATSHHLGVCLDVTERKHMEESASRFAAIVEASANAVVSTKLDGTILSWNKSAEQMYGFRAVDVLGQNLFDIVAPGQHAGMQAMIERLRNGETIRLPDLVWITPDLRRVDMAVTLAPIPDHAGHWVGISSVAHDITERKRAEAAVAESEARLKAVIENSPDRIWSLDCQYRVLVANSASAAAALAEYGQALVVGESAVEAPFGPEVKAFWLPIYDRVLAGESVRMEDTTPSTGIALELVLHPIRDTGGLVTGVAARAIDITERIRLEGALRNSVKRLKAIIENTSDMIWSVDQAYRVLVANTACIGRRRRIWACASRVTRCLTPPNAPVVREMLETALRPGICPTPERFEFESPLHPGRTMECFLDPIRDEQGHVTSGRPDHLTSPRLQKHDYADCTATAPPCRWRRRGSVSGTGISAMTPWSGMIACELYGVPNSIRDSVIYGCLARTLAS